MSERRYSDEEMALIFERASTDPEPGSERALSGATGAPAPAKGMTLRELQEIGAEAGISPEAVARAAGALTRTADAEPGDGSALSRPIRTETSPLTIAAVPAAVGESVELDRMLTDAEWGEFVGLLRHTFQAQGKVGSGDGFREWRNGNLSISLEPLPGGARLSMRSRKSNAEAGPVFGIAFLGLATMFTILGIFGAKELSRMLPLAGTFALFGAGAMTVGIANVRRWAALRKEQFQALAERVSSVTRGPAGGVAPESLPGTVAENDASETGTEEV